MIPELGLYYYKARFYSPTLGRFLQTDPIGTKDDQNLYAYVGNNPINRTDPSGLLAKEAIALTGRIGSAAMQGIDEFVTGGYGQRANEAIAAGDYAAASGYLAAGTLYGAMNVATGLEGGVAAKAAANVANGPRLANQLINESARSPFTSTGTLTQEALSNSRAIPNLGPGQLSNPAIPKGFGKYTTETLQSPAGDFQMHFYMNPKTGEPFYGLDYKAIFNNAFGAGR